MKIVAVTNCTNRKRHAPGELTRARSLRQGEATVIAQDWWGRIEAEEALDAARCLYKGRAFVEAIRATEACGGELWIVSAGLGLVEGSKPVPAYSLTITPRSPDTILSKAGCTPREWWRALQAAAGHQTWPS